MVSDPHVAEFLFDHYPLVEKETKSIIAFLSDRMSDSPNRLITLLSAFFAAEIMRNTVATISEIELHELEGLTDSATVVFKELQGAARGKPA